MVYLIPYIDNTNLIALGGNQNGEGIEKKRGRGRRRRLKDMRRKGRGVLKNRREEGGIGRKKRNACGCGPKKIIGEDRGSARTGK